MAKDLSRNLTLIIGGSGDIGSSIVELLLKQGSFVIATYAQHKERLAQLYKKYRTKLVIQQCDVTSDSFEKEATILIKKFYKLAENSNITSLGIMYLSGVFLPDIPAKPLGPQENKKIWAINFLGAELFIKLFLQYGSGDTRRKVMVAISSTASKGEGSATTYSLTKASLESLFMSTGEFHASRNNVRTLIVRPTWIDGAFLRKQFPPELITQLSKAVPTYVLPQSDEVAKILVENFRLIIKTNAYNNVLIPIDGGRR